MTDQPHDLPDPHLPPPAAVPSAAVPPAGSPPAATDDLWGDGAGAGAADPARATGPRSGHPARTWLVAGVGAVAIAVASFAGITVVSNHTGSSATASAQTGPGGQTGFGGQAGPGGGTSGTIASIDGSTVTLTSSSGTRVTVATSDATTVTRDDPATLADVAVGDQVSVMGTTSGSDVAAQRIIDTGTTADTGPGGAGGGQGAPPSGSGGAGATGQAPPAGGSSSGQAAPGGSGGPGGMVRGQVTSVDGSTLVVTATDGTTHTVTASDSTTVSRESASSVASLTVGESVQVMGAAASGGTVTAARIVEGATAMGAPPAA